MAARSPKRPSPIVEAVAASFLKGFVKRPTAHTPRRIEASSAPAHVAVSRKMERPAVVFSATGTPTTTLHPKGSTRLKPVMRVTWSLQAARPDCVKDSKEAGAGSLAAGFLI